MTGEPDSAAKPAALNEEFMEVEGAAGGGSSGDENDNELNEVKAATARAANHKPNPEGNAIVGAGAGPGGIDKKDQVLVHSDILDLEAYANGYAGGLPKINRLKHIADHCPPLRIEALKLAIKCVKETANVSEFRHLNSRLQTAVSNQAIPIGGGGAAPADLPQLDQEWLDESSRICMERLGKLMADLNAAEMDSEKQEISMKLGEHYLDVGDPMTAFRNLLKARDYATKQRNYNKDDLIKIWLGMIRVEMYFGNWPSVFAHLTKISMAFQDPSIRPSVTSLTKLVADADKEDDKEKTKLDPALEAFLNCVAGIAELGQKQYKSAAKYFVKVDARVFEMNEFATGNNVGLYGSICALATFNRAELRREVLFNSSFKEMLENEPELREALTTFECSKYSACLRLLDDMKYKLILDLYLSPHVAELYSLIRKRSLVQYCLPYASADLHRMATNFNSTVLDLENELIDLILNGEIHGRIDSQNKIFHASQENQRMRTFVNAERMGEEYHRRTKLMLLRAELLRNNIEVIKPIQTKKPKQGKGKGNAASKEDLTKGRDLNEKEKEQEDHNQNEVDMGLEADLADQIDLPD